MAAACLVPQCLILAMVLGLLQLTAVPDNPHGDWSAAAWMGMQRSGNSWQEAGGTAAEPIPWCPNNPNNHNLDGEETCTTMMTFCSPSGGALVNDYPCHYPLRVLCAYPTMACGETTGAEGFLRLQGAN
jgi:hypothetical protein